MAFRPITNHIYDFKINNVGASPHPHELLLPAGAKVCKNPTAGDKDTIDKMLEMAVLAERPARGSVRIVIEMEYPDWSSAVTQSFPASYHRFYRFMPIATAATECWQGQTLPQRS